MKNTLYIVTLALAATLTLSACEGSKSAKVSEIQKKDKMLSCKEVQLEINEAEFYRKTAEKNKGPKVENLIMPLGYVSTYMSAEDAIQASDARVDYLNRVYEILDCDNPKSEAHNRVPAYNGAAGGGPMNASALSERMYNRDEQAARWRDNSWYY